MHTSNPKRTLNNMVMLFTVFLVIQSNFVFPAISSNIIIQLVVIISAKGFYELVIVFIYWCINHNPLLLHAVWGALYLKGFWSYTYTLGGVEYFGVWEIDQDIDGHRVVGNGLDSQLHVRTIVRSVSPLIEEQGGFYFINIRNELHNENARVLSKTTLLLDRPSKFWGRVRSMRATTEVFGGPSDGQLHPDVVFKKHFNASSIEDVIAQLNIDRSPSL